MRRGKNTGWGEKKSIKKLRGERKTVDVKLLFACFNPCRVNFKQPLDGVSDLWFCVFGRLKRL